MRIALLVVVTWLSLVSAIASANDDPARFWISTSKDSPIVGEAPVINAAIGRQRTLYIWAQPATNSLGAFRTIQDFSLNVVTQTETYPFQSEPEPFVDFVDGTFKVYNDDVVGLAKRFQNKTDSSTPEPQGGALTSVASEGRVLDFDEADAIIGLQGLSPKSTAGVAGIGNSADQAPYRVGAAWRVAEFTFKTLQPDVGKTTTNTLFLQIGYAGILFQGGGNTLVRLGDNHGDPYHTTCTIADPCGDWREVNRKNDTFDIKINAVPSTPGDYNGDGAIGQADYAYWRGTFGQSVASLGEGADGNSNGVVDAADYVFWRNRVSTGAASGVEEMMRETSISLNIVPEPATVVLACVFALVAPPWRGSRIDRSIVPGSFAI